LDGNVAYVTGRVTDSNIFFFLGAGFMTRVEDRSGAGMLDVQFPSGPVQFSLPCADNPADRAAYDQQWVPFFAATFPADPDALGGEDQLSEDPVKITVSE